MIITNVVNGVICTIQPALLVGQTPNGVSCNFSNDPSLGSTITIEFSSPITQFSINAIASADDLLRSITVAALDASGNVIDSKNVPYATAGGSATVGAGSEFSSVQLAPNSGDTAYFSGISLVTSIVNPPQPAPGTRTPPPPNDTNPTIPASPPIISVTGPTVSIGNILTFSQNIFSETYRKGSLAPIAPETFTITNTSAAVDVNISIDAASSGIVFTPSTFTVPANSNISVMIEFVSSILDGLPLGVNSFNNVINATSTTPIISVTPVPTTPEVPIIPTIPTEPPVVNVPTFPEPTPSTPTQPAPIQPTPTSPEPQGPVPINADPSIVAPPDVLINTLPTRPAIPVVTPPPASDTNPSTIVPPITFTVQTWVDGLDGSVHVGSPPAGWLQQPDGSWVPPVGTQPVGPKVPANPGVQQVLNNPPPTSAPITEPVSSLPPPTPPAPTDTGGNTISTDTLTINDLE